MTSLRLGVVTYDLSGVPDLSGTPLPLASVRRQRSGCRAGILIAAALTIVIVTAPAVAQVAVMANPTTYSTWNNKTNSYSVGAAIAYSADADSYVNAATIQGVPNNLYSYVVTQGNPTGSGLGFITSTVGIPQVGAAPAQPFNLTLPAMVAGRPTANTSLGGMIDGFGWGAADVVMNQCFGGGFAFNIAGSLQGAIPAGGGAPVAPTNRIGYTFSSGANYNELSYGITLPNGNSTPATATALGDFTQGQAYGGTKIAIRMYSAYELGVSKDPFTVGGTGYGIDNQVPTNPGPPATPRLQAGGFESPVYASSDALAAGAVNPQGPNNARSYATAPADRWAVLAAFTPNRSEFSLDIQREYAALISNGVPQNHIAVLYGDGTSGSLARFTAINADNNFPDVNGILNGVGANFTVPVQGAASQANIAGLFNPTIIENPTAPVANQVNFWQYLFHTGHGGASPAAGNNLLFYSTGHGSAVNIFGGDVTAANRATGNVFTTQIKLTGPDNVEIIPGTNITAQIATRGLLVDPASDLFSIDGNSVGGDSLASVADGTAFDLSNLLEQSGGPTLDYYDLTIPSTDFSGTDAGGEFMLSVFSTDDSAIVSLDENIDAITLMDGTPSACAAGTCDMYTDTIAISEPSSLALLVAGLGWLGIAEWRRKHCWNAA